MKNLTHPSHGRSIPVDYNCATSDVDGGSEPSFYTRRQETSVRSFGTSNEICNRSESDCIWEEIEYLLNSLDRTKRELVNGTDWDRAELDWINERYSLCRRQALHYVLCQNLYKILSTVTFPGEKLSYLQIAERVIKDCTSRELQKSIESLGLNPFARVYFKVEDGMPIEKAEQILLTMLGDGEYILAQHYPDKLGVSANSGWYKNLKKELQAKGWEWKSKKIKGSVVKVIKR